MTEEKQVWTKPEADATEKPPEKAPEPTAKVEEGKVEQSKAPQIDVASTPAYKTLQTKLNRANEELARAKAQHASLTTIEARTAKTEQILEAMVEEFSRNREQEEETPVRTPNLKQRYEAIKGQAEAQRKQDMPGEPTDEAYVTIKEKITEAGMELNDPKFEYAAYLYSKGKNVSALREVDRVLGETGHHETPEEMEKRISAKVRKDLGIDSVDTSTSTGKHSGKKPSLEELRKTPALEVKRKYAAGEWSDK